MSDWFEAERCADRAQRHMAAGAFDQALRSLERAVAINPYQADWHLQLGIVLEAVGRMEEAAACLGRAETLGYGVEASWRLGRVLRARGRWREAEARLEAAIDRDGDFESAWCDLVATRVDLGAHEEAETTFYMARDRFGECPACYHHLARSLKARGALGRAGWCWHRVAELDPAHPEVELELARLARRRHDDAGAVASYLRHLRRERGDAEAIYELACYLLELGRIGEARDHLRELLSLAPTHAGAHVALGDLAMRAGTLERAERRFRRAWRLDPGRGGLALRRASVARRRGDFEGARRLLRLELESAERSAEETIELSRMLVESGDAALAEAPLGVLLERSDLEARTRAAAWLHRGVARLVQGRLREGIADCRRSLALAEDWPLAMHNLVLAHAEAGDLARARVWWRRLYRRDPEARGLGALRRRLWLLACRRRLARLWRSWRGAGSAG